MTAQQRHQIAKNLYPALVVSAQKEATGTYVDWFTQQTQGNVTNRRQLASILDIPERYFLQHGAPDLTGVIVRKDNSLPGMGFWVANQTTKNRTTWQTIMRQVRMYSWPTKCPY